MSQRIVLIPKTALNVRQGPGIEYKVLDVVYPSDRLLPRLDFHGRLGHNGDWARVRTPSSLEGWAATWYVSLKVHARESALYLTPTTRLNVRQGPGVDFSIIDLVKPGDELTLEESGSLQLGRFGEWIAVHTPDGVEGWVAAWYVVAKLAAQDLTSTVPLRVRAGAGRHYRHLATVVPGMRLIALDPDAAGNQVGRWDTWIHLRTLDGVEGWAAAWYLRLVASYPLLVVPWVSQIDKQSEGAFDCGQASLLMLLKFYGKVNGDVTVDDLSSRVPKYTSANQLRDLAGYYEFSPKTLYIRSVDTLRALVDSGRPAVVLVDYAKLEFPDHLLSGSDQGWHWLVVVGYRDDGTFIVHDPLWLPYQRGGHGGAYLTIARNRLQNALLWQDTGQNVVY